VSASLTGSRQNTGFGGGFPASYGNSNAYAISLTQPLIHVDSWHGCAQGRCARRARQPRDRTIAESIERSGCDRRPCRHFAARIKINTAPFITLLHASASETSHGFLIIARAPRSNSIR
jgi:hypothetical protein